LEEDDEHGLEDIVPLHNTAINMEWTEKLENGNAHKLFDLLQPADEKLQDDKVHELFDFPQSAKKN
jgi:hypothetical protein